MHRYFRLLALITLLLRTGLSAFGLSLTGCDGQSVSIENPQRIVVLNASTYEILRDIGEDFRIVGADSATHALIPGAAEKGIANYGHHAQPAVEAVIATRPDLVLANAGVLRDAVPVQLRSAGLPVLLLEHSAKGGIEGLKRRIAAIAAVFGKQAEGRALVEKTDARLVAIEVANAKVVKKKAVFFLYTHGTATYSGSVGTRWLIELAGARPVGPFTGTKPISPEALAEAAPDTIVLLQRNIDALGGVNAVFSLPGVSLTPAGKNRAIHIVDNGAPWIGTRFLDHVEKLHRELYPTTPAQVP